MNFFWYKIPSVRRTEGLHYDLLEISYPEVLTMDTLQ